MNTGHARAHAQEERPNVDRDATKERGQLDCCWHGSRKGKTPVHAGSRDSGVDFGQLKWFEDRTTVISDSTCKAGRIAQSSHRLLITTRK